MLFAWQGKAAAAVRAGRGNCVLHEIATTQWQVPATWVTWTGSAAEISLWPSPSKSIRRIELVEDQDAVALGEMVPVAALEGAPAGCELLLNRREVRPQRRRQPQ
ncbi:hypothetical protein GCM10009610_35240 [Pseudonocardia xinjiangensis]